MYDELATKCHDASPLDEKTRRLIKLGAAIGVPSEGAVKSHTRRALAATYHGLNPMRLLKQINSNLEQLWQLAIRPASLGNRNYEVIVDGEMLSDSIDNVDFYPLCTYSLAPDDVVWLNIDGKPELMHRFCKDYDMP